MADEKKTKRKKQPDLHLGEMPVGKIKTTIDVDLEPGPVVLTAGAQKHAASRHPEDYAECMPHLAGIIASPLYIGDDLNNLGIELIGRIRALDSAVLVAVTIDKDERGRYRVCSFYPISEAKIENRRARRFLKPAV
ncbi:MAG: PBECR2 nuclease fold domain-containing protein [Beijerinckiaceae bacterium]|nr:PBECR2 nuclease fold domain-containing protein [Beijerinckiaceae bacterium]